MSFSSIKNLTSGELEIKRDDVNPINFFAETILSAGIGSISSGRLVVIDEAFFCG